MGECVRGRAGRAAPAPRTNGHAVHRRRRPRNSGDRQLYLVESRIHPAQRANRRRTLEAGLSSEGVSGQQERHPEGRYAGGGRDPTATLSGQSLQPRPSGERPRPERARASGGKSQVATLSGQSSQPKPSGVGREGTGAGGGAPAQSKE